MDKAPRSAPIEPNAPPDADERAESPKPEREYRNASTSLWAYVSPPKSTTVSIITSFFIFNLCCIRPFTPSWEVLKSSICSFYRLLPEVLEELDLLPLLELLDLDGVLTDLDPPPDPEDREGVV